MKYGFFRYRRAMARRTAGRVLLIAIALLLFSVVYVVTSQLRPLLESLAVTRASSAVNRIVIEAVDEAIQNGSISYEQLISFEKDGEGKISVVHSNMAACNRLQAEILDIILERIGQVSARELSIPVGTLTGSALLAGRGPGSQCGWSRWVRPRRGLKTSSPQPASTRPTTASCCTSTFPSPFCCPASPPLPRSPTP